MVQFWQGLQKATEVELLDKVLLGKNVDGSTTYTDIQQIKNLIAAFTNGAIVPTKVAAGATLGSPTTPQILYAGAGTYTAPSGTITLTANLNMLFWDLTTWSSLAVPVTLVDYYNKNELNQIIGIEKLTNYSKDFSTISTISTNGVPFFNNVPVVTRGTLKSVRVKATVGSTITIYAYSVSGTTATLQHTYTPIVTSTLEQTITFTSDVFIVEAGWFIAVKSSVGLYYNATGGNSYYVSGTTVSALQGNQIAVDFIINETGAVGISQQVADLQLLPPKVTALETVTGVLTLASYSKDFSAVNTLGGSNFIYANVVPTTKVGTLRSVRVKGVVGDTITVYAYRIVNNSNVLTCTLLKNYGGTVLTTATQTIDFSTDTFLIEAGAFIAFSSAGTGIYYTTTTGQSYSITQNNINGFTVALDFVIDETVSGTVLRRLGTLESLKLDVVKATVQTHENKVSSTVLTSYTKDFSVINSLGGANYTYANNVPVLRIGTLRSVRVKGVIGDTITVYAYRIVNNNGVLTCTMLKNYGGTILTSTTQTIDFSSDTYQIEVGAFIAFSSAGTGIYYTTSTGQSYSITDRTVQGYSVSLDYIIDETPLDSIFRVVQPINNRLNLLEAKTTDHDTKLAALSTIKLPPVILYQNYFSSLGSEFEQVNWSTVSAGVKPSAVGAGSYLWLKKRYHVDYRKLMLTVTASSCRFCIAAFGLDVHQGEGYFYVDFAANKLQIYNQSNTLLVEKALTSNSVVGRKYTVVVDRKEWISTFTLIDTVTNISTELVYSVTTSSALNENMQNDSYKFYVESGTITEFVLNSMLVTTGKPNVVLMGDSISATMLFSNATYGSSYTNLLRAKLGGNILISARGSAVLQDCVDKVTSELSKIKPTYCMLNLGTNMGGWSEANYLSLVNSIIALGVIPICNHIPNRGTYGAGNEHIAVNNSIDAVCKQTGAIIGARFDIATSTGGDPSASYISSLYFGDGIHPNVTGHLAMYNRFAIDLPFLF